jgi:hypothetical protein
MFQTKVVENYKTHFICNTFFSPENRSVFLNVQKYCRAGKVTGGTVIRRMRFACWITKATNTHSEYVIPRRNNQQEATL